MHKITRKIINQIKGGVPNALLHNNICRLGSDKWCAVFSVGDIVIDLLPWKNWIKPFWGQSKNFEKCVG